MLMYDALLGDNVAKEADQTDARKGQGLNAVS